MLRTTVIVDGSNIATEGRSSPSLRQLDEAVQAFLAEHPTDHTVVVVDATFGHRIDAKERPEFEEAILAGELVTPPAGTIGRGDAFILQIADKAGATVLSNDSFQELHGQYPWLFDEGRLVGGKPVPGLGWVFMLRTPVRGPISRRSVRGAKSTPQRPTQEVAAQKQTPVKAGSGGRSPKKPGAPLNDPLPFIEFVGAHPVGSTVNGEVVEFSSHGAYAMVSGARCYIPLRLMGDPPPRSAKEIMRLGEERAFVVYALDPPRRGIDLALGARRPNARTDLPAKRQSVKSTHDLRKDGVARIKEETTDDVLAEERATGTGVRKANTRTSAVATTSAADNHAEEAPVTPAKKSAPRKTTKKAAKKTTRKAAKKTARKSTARKATKKAAPKKAAKKAARKTTKKAAKRAPARKAAKKTTKKTTKKAAKRAPARKGAKKAAKRTTKKAAKRAPARKGAKKAAKRTARKAPARRR